MAEHYAYLGYSLSCECGFVLSRTRSKNGETLECLNPECALYGKIFTYEPIKLVEITDEQG